MTEEDMGSGRRLPANGGSRPVPDPTELTDRAIARLEKTLTLYIDGEIKALIARLEAMDKAVELRSETVEDIHQDIEAQVRHLRALHTERFKGLERRLQERDTRTATEKIDAKVAVDAAFAAAKEAAAKQDEANAKAIDKSERATSETIKTNQELTKAATDTLTKDVDTLKQQVATILATGIGRTEQRGSLYATIGIVITIVLFGLAIITFFAARAPV